MPATVIALDRFSGVFGADRGARKTQTADGLADVLARDGLDEALRAVGTDRARLAEDPVRGKLLTDAALDIAYAELAPSLSKQLKVLAVRPHWALQFAVSGLHAHHVPDGHLYADTEDLNAQPVTAACGLVPDNGWNLLNRGAWARMLTKPTPALSACDTCAELAAGHPETLPADSSDPIPADRLHPLLASWRAEHAAPLLAGMAAGKPLVGLLADASDALTGPVRAWAFETLAAHPRPNVLRALRSNGALNTMSEFANFEVARRLADRGLTAQQWEDVAGPVVLSLTASQWAQRLLAAL